MTTGKPEIYVSTDVETDGPIPGPHSVLSLASAAYLADKTLIGTFSANLETLPGAGGHPETMTGWSKSRAAWETCQAKWQSPERAMRNYVDWLKNFRASLFSWVIRRLMTARSYTGI